jgi:biotin transport system substrate-specific component
MNDAILRMRRAATVEVVPSRTARRVLAVLAFAIATALAAQVRVPLPFTPIPMTLQTLFVLAAGALLGPKLGAASQLAYLGAGAAGLPVFAAGGGFAYLLGPTGGYLLAFPVAAFLAGVVTDRFRSPGIGGLLTLFVALFLVSLVILLGGGAWLATLNGDPLVGVALGIVPFLAGDLVKVALAALLAWRGRDRTLGLL